MSKRTRNRFTSQEKVAILRLHLLEHTPVSTHGIRVKTPLSVDDARRLVAEFVNHYDRVRLHSAIAYIAPADKLAGPALAIWAARKHKLATADARRRAKDQGKGNGPATVLSNTLRRPQRKIGKRGDTTRAPTQGQDRKGRHEAAPRPFRDWLQSDKSVHKSCFSRLP